MITSRHNELLKELRRLHERRGRSKLGRFLIEGARAVETALSAGAEVELLLVEAGHEAAWSGRGVELQALATGLLATVSDVAGEVPVIAVARSPERAVEDWPAVPQRLLVLDEVRDPGNVGTLLRTADAVGAGVVLAGGCADPLSPKVVRASAGSVVRVLWSRLEVGQAVEWLAGLEHSLAVLDPVGDEAWLGGPVPHPLALVAGSEAHGPGPAWREVRERWRLPMRSGTESLNVAVAAAVALFESVRQHGLQVGDEGAE